MANKGNALAELADRLDLIADVFSHEKTTRFEDVTAAQEIIRELAKV